MVTSNKVPDKKVVKMVEHNTTEVVPQRTLLGEVNEHITCPLCRGYYIDATTIVECLHSFCRSCIIKHLKVKSYCPVCEMMINSAKPNIKLDKALQDIVYKLVPGLFQKEMERRQTFYSSRPGPAASATPEQRGEDTERIIFSPEDVISFSLEYVDATDADSISSKSSDSNEPPSTASARRYLQCPAVVNISHLKKFLSMKFDIDSTQYAIDILYKRVPLPDYYTLMDIAYIYNWKRNEPMRFFYQIIDYVAIRNRILEINRQCSKFSDSKVNLSEDINRSSPALPISDLASEPSSGNNSPMPDETCGKQENETKKSDKFEQSKETFEKLNAERSSSFPKKEDVEKSQFLNSFELAPKSTCVNKSPSKANTGEAATSDGEPTAATSTATTSSSALPSKIQEVTSKSESKQAEPQKRKQQSANALEMKRLKIELEKTKINQILNNYANSSAMSNTPSSNTATKTEPSMKGHQPETPTVKSNSVHPPQNKEIKSVHSTTAQQLLDCPGIKRNVTAPHSVPTSKRKPTEIASALPNQSPQPKTISPLKIQVPKIDHQAPQNKNSDSPKPVKKMPDLKPGVPPSHILHNKTPVVNKVRMDLLANNSDPTMDRSKILSQVKTSMSAPQTPSPGPTSGDPLKSLFDSCKINIPSSLSITLFDQKVEPRNQGDHVNTITKKTINHKNLPGTSSNMNIKIPGPLVPNQIEIMKLPDTDPKKLSKGDTPESKTSQQIKHDASAGLIKPPTKSNETPATPSAKGPVPNLKPIADTKLAKQTPNPNFIGPITFQQTFEQQLQALQGDKKSKATKNKTVPKLVPATPKSLSAANFLNKTVAPGESKGSTALDLSSNNAGPSTGTQQTFDKTFEAMQSIANLAKKQNIPAKTPPLNISQNSAFSIATNKPVPGSMTHQPARIPPTSTINQIKLDKVIPTASQMNIARQETINKSSLMKQGSLPSPSTSVGYQMSPSHASPSPSAQPSPRQIRSPSSSPKLVIAEEKQMTSAPLEQSMNQSNQISSTQHSHLNSLKSELPSTVAGPSKSGIKSMKPFAPTVKLPGRQPITPNVRPGPPNIPTSADYGLRPAQFMAQQAIMRHQMEMNAAWMNAKRQYDFDLFKNMSNMAHQAQNDRDKQQK